ncbi:MAG: hypothetical protein IJ877_04470 [Candidatus Gastranaerophilales bacterium]|nr:hypothetical protein [Candidatus Gastranaerophilales bacterium]
MKITPVSLNFSSKSNYAVFDENAKRKIIKLAQENISDDEALSKEYLLYDENSDILSCYSGKLLKALYMWELQTHTSSAQELNDEL